MTTDAMTAQQLAHPAPGQPKQLNPYLAGEAGDDHHAALAELAEVADRLLHIRGWHSYVYRTCCYKEKDTNGS